MKTQFKRRSAVNDLRIMIPVPDGVDSPKMKATIGHGTYVPAESAIAWKIAYLPGSKEGSLHIRCGLPLIKDASSSSTSVPSPEKSSAATKPLGPIRAIFEIPYFTMSGIQVRYLKIVEKSGYPALPWVRYITEQGEYQFRMPETTGTSGGWPGSIRSS